MAPCHRFDAVFAELARSPFRGALAICIGKREPIVHTFGNLDESPTDAITDSTLFDVCSVTKNFTARAIRRLELENRLSLRQSIAEFHEDVPGELAGIRIEHLLEHSSGLPDLLDAEGAPRAYALEDDYAPLSRDEFWRRLLRSRLLFPPGERWSYSNAGYTLLAAIVEQIAQQEFEEFLSRTLLRPAGMIDTGYHFPRRQNPRIACGFHGPQNCGRPGEAAERVSWNLIGNGGLLSTIADLLRWKTCFCDLRQLDNELGASRQSLFVDPQQTIVSGNGLFIRESNSEPGPLIYHNGSNTIFSATLRWFPQSDVYAIVLSSQSEVSAMSVAKRLGECWMTNSRDDR
jgi:CubicO group peptidase (beta-lactamase class C family)